MPGSGSRRPLAVLALGAIVLVPPVALAQDTTPTVAGCPVLPADDIWNTPIDTLPVHPQSDAWIETIGPDTGLKADFGSGEWEGAPIGIPYTVVPGDQPRVDLRFEYADESDPGPYPIPPDPPIEGGPDSDGDRHILVVDRDTCALYEVFDAHPNDDGSWSAGSGATYDLRSSALRPDGWTSADAAGLPILPGLARYDEIAAGEIRHALRFTVPETQRAYLWPARHFASRIEDEAYPPMGARFRLRADLDISGFSAENQVILRALQRYGMVLADNGSAWYLSGVPDPGWDDDALRELLDVVGTDFEAVDVSSLMADPDSGQARLATGTTSREPDLFVDAAAAGPRTGSRETPFASIQAAIDAAPDGAVIEVAAGDYPEGIRIEGRTLAIQGAGAEVTTLQGDGSDSVVTLLEAGETSIEGFRITGGGPSSVPEYGHLGAGVFIRGGSPTLRALVVEGNDARVPGAPDTDMLGGGIYADAPVVTITDSVIRGNTAGRGGGIAAFGGQVRIIGNVIEDNTGVSDHGGGVYLAASDIEMRGNRIAGNVIGREMGYGWGGGIIVYGEGSRALLTGNEITGNFAPSVGAGVFIDDRAVATLDHELIHHNVCVDDATTGGVGVYVDGYDGVGSTVEIRGSTIAGNGCRTTQGGNALYVEAGSQVTIRDSVLWGNGGDDVLTVDPASTVSAAYTLSEEAIEGEGNLSADPLFVDSTRATCTCVRAARPSMPPIRRPPSTRSPSPTVAAPIWARMAARRTRARPTEGVRPGMASACGRFCRRSARRQEPTDPQC